VSGPKRMMNGVKATGLRCRQRSQTTQHHGQSRRSCSRVGAGGWGFMHQRIARFVPAEQPRGMVASSSDDTLHVEMTSGHERFGTLNRTASPLVPRVATSLS
jgi:hypothetical protein